MYFILKMVCDHICRSNANCTCTSSSYYNELGDNTKCFQINPWEDGILVTFILSIFCIFVTGYYYYGYRKIKNWTFFSQKTDRPSLCPKESLEYVFPFLVGCYYIFFVGFTAREWVSWDIAGEDTIAFQYAVDEESHCDKFMNLSTESLGYWWSSIFIIPLTVIGMFVLSMFSESA